MVPAKTPWPFAPGLLGVLLGLGQGEVLGYHPPTLSFLATLRNYTTHPLSRVQCTEVRINHPCRQKNKTLDTQLYTHNKYL